MSFVNYLELLRYGAYAAIGCLLLLVACVVLLIVLIAQRR